MHPAPSLILFTTLSGLGFGLLAFLCLGLPDARGLTAVLWFGAGFALAGGGLLASTTHLGNPQRAWRAFTHWQTSWLSREAWLSVLSLAAAGGVALGRVFFDLPMTGLGTLAAGLALATVASTAMIYAQLKTVPRWNHWTTPALFLSMALAGGALLAGQMTVAPVLLLLAGAVQLLAWRTGDGRFAARGHGLASATRLEGGTVRSFAPPHTGSNYLLREMVHQVGRRHARKLRSLALIFGFLAPALLCLTAHPLALVLAVLSHAGGAMAGRWLFFAEAEHVVGLYYGYHEAGAR